ncbi:HEAT repeat domain-containing protein [Kitasatospora sp. DSM 101779]|uniref:HEAT repeat domain-containing protein n=1 Tax=Kitasatospora sp. DSM 101779 TaxID=2853165 RepID=UPI0021D9FAC3|nr:hypothetical protein [Kitasatospora sp. DSM 101779]MCU7826603.1 hypothetical protein [Kitasatospora sp. DSM 101779]
MEKATEQHVSGLVELLGQVAGGDAGDAVARLVAAGEAAVPALLAARPEFERSGRPEVAQALREIGPPAVRAAAAASTEGGIPPKERELAALLGLFDARCLDELAALLGHAVPEVRGAALTALHGLGPDARPALAAVLPFLGNRREEFSARRFLDALGPAAADELLAVRADGPGRLRRHALHALAHLGACDGLSARDRAALERLVRIKLLDDRLPDEMWDFHWVAVPGEGYQAAFDALGLHDRTPATLAMGLTGRVHDEAVVARPDGTDLTVHRVFVTPEIAGWRLFFGTVLVNCPDDGRLERLAEACGQAHYCYRDGYEDCHHWAIAERGRGVVRSFQTYREPAWTGDPLPWEEPQTEDPLWEPGMYEPNASLESDAQAVAGRLTVDPEEIDEDTPMAGHGWFAVTAPGVGRGVFPGALSV